MSDEEELKDSHCRDCHSALGACICNRKLPVVNDEETIWTKVEDKLPSADMNVLTYRKDGSMEVDFIIKGFSEVGWCGTITKDWDIITHWTPLPAPPKDEV